MKIAGRIFAGLLVISIAASGGCAMLKNDSGDNLMQYETFGPAPKPSPNRAISEQDCSHPIAFDGGNLHCT